MVMFIAEIFLKRKGNSEKAKISRHSLVNSVCGRNETSVNVRRWRRPIDINKLVIGPFIMADPA